jgi:hypothetical protein
MEKLSDQELRSLSRLLAEPSRVGTEALKAALVRLAHDAGDEAVEILGRARGRIPPSLRGFFECAWDECCYFNFVSHVSDVSLTGEDLQAETDLDRMTEDELSVECEELEMELAERGVLVDLVPGLPVRIRLAYVRRLLESIGELRYLGSGFVHFDGCSSACSCCIQRPWCDLAEETILEAPIARSAES